MLWLAGQWLRTISVILDTNALLRFLLNDDVDQSEHVERMLELAAADMEEVVVPVPVFFEISYVLLAHYRLTTSDYFRVMRVILFDSSIIIPHGEREMLMESLFLQEKSGLSLTDSYLLVLTKRQSDRLLTFDKKMRYEAKSEEVIIC